MFAPFASSRAPRGLAVVALVLTVALLAGGCTLPGRGRLAPAPKDLPPSMRWVPSDAPAFVVVDTDRSATAWRQLRAGAQDFLPTDLRDRLTTSSRDDGRTVMEVAVDRVKQFRQLHPERWVGPAAGAVLLSTDLGAEDAVYGYADVRDRGALEDELRSNEWTRDGAPSGRGSSGFERWRGYRGVAAVSRDVVLFARSADALDEILARTSQGRVSDDLDLRKDAVESLRDAPVGVVFREDALANQLRRIVRDDPAKLELARWLDDSSLVASVLDGWVGVNGHADATAGLQLTGRIHWVPESLRVRRPGTVERATLDQQSPYVQAAVVFDDLGLVAEDLVGSATANGSEFATKRDVPDSKDSVNLFGALDDLDEDSIVVKVDDRYTATVESSHPVRGADEVENVINHLGRPGHVVTRSSHDAVQILTDDAQAQRMHVAPPTSPRSLSARDDYVDARYGLTTAPKRTLAWFTFLRDPAPKAAGTTCVGWLGEAGHDRLSFSLGITPPARAGDLAGGCTARLAALL